MDGCLDNVFQLEMILRQQYQSLKPLNMASLDVAKAFPSVSRRPLLMAMPSFGVRTQFVEYMERVYGRGLYDSARYWLVFGPDLSSSGSQAGRSTLLAIIQSSDLEGLKSPARRGRCEGRREDH